MNTQEDQLLGRMVNIVQRGRLAHAYLIQGDDLEQLRGFAYKLVAICLCQNLTEAGACGECAHCQSLARGSYPAIAELEPKSRSRQILIDEVRTEFEAKFQVKADEGKLRVGIISECDRMVTAAQNSFLKTLEEPPPGSLMILITVRPGGLLPTIRSRCQVLSLRSGVRFNFNALEPLLAGLKAMNPDRGAEAALICSTLLSEVLDGLRAEAQSRCEFNEARPDETSADKKRREDANKALEQSEYLSLREQVLGVLQTWFGQIYLLSEGAGAEAMAHPEFFDALPTHWQVAPERARKMVEVCQRFIDLVHTNVKESLLIDDFLLKICRK